MTQQPSPRRNRAHLAAALALGLFGSTAASASTPVEAHIALLKARIAQKGRLAKITAAATPAKLGPAVHQLFTALAKHQAMFGSPDQGLEIATHGNERIEIGSTRFQVRAQDGVTIRPATTDDLAAVGLGHGEAVRAALAIKLKSALGMPESAQLGDKALIDAVGPAIEQGKAQVKALSNHPDVLRLVLQRRTLAKATALSQEPIELLGSNDDASLSMDHEGKLEFRFGSLKRTPTMGDLTFVGFTNEQQTALHLGRRLVEGSQKPSSSVERVRAEIDALRARQEQEQNERAAAAARLVKDKADVGRFLKTPTKSPAFKFLADLRVQTKRRDITIATKTDSASGGWELLVTKQYDGRTESTLLWMRRPNHVGYSAVTFDHLKDIFGIASMGELEQAFEKAILGISPSEI